MAGDIALQARPLHKLFISMKTDNIEMFQTIWTHKYCKRFEKKGWAETLMHYKKVSQSLGMGEWITQNIRFRVKLKNKTHAKIEIWYQQKQYGEMKVKKEDKKWLINER